MPLPGQLREQPVHLGLGADVDAPGGLVDDQQSRRRSPATWRSRPSAGCHRSSSWRPCPAHRSSPRAGRPTARRTATRRPLLSRPARVRPPADRLRPRCGRPRPRRRAPACGGPRGRTRCRRGWRPAGCRRDTAGPPTQHPAGVVAVDAEHGAGDLAAPGADEACQPDDLAGTDLERHVVEESRRAEALDLQHRLTDGGRRLREQVARPRGRPSSPRCGRRRSPPCGRCRRRRRRASP